MKKYSYVTLLTSDNYIDGVLLLDACLKRVNSQYPFLCLVTTDLSKKTLDILEAKKINYRYVGKIAVSDRIYEHNKAMNPKRADI